MKKILTIVVFAVTAMVAENQDAFAYQYWSNGVNDQGQCAGCHGAFREGDYFSNSEGIFWGDNLHAIHLANTDVESSPNGGCGSCHDGAGVEGRQVDLSRSAVAKDGVNAVSCMGCHGRFEDENTLSIFGNGWGAGLRQQHEGSTNPLVGPGSCAGCHSDNSPASFTTAPESTMPPWYASVTNTSINMTMDPCSADGQEDFSSNGSGLDNDGDGNEDGLDSDCVAPTPTPGDFNFDGKADILWRNTSNGQNWLYTMNGATIDGSSGVNTVNSQNWVIVGNGDYDGNGTADILWRNSVTGQNWMYLMSGSTISSSLGVNTVADTNWIVAGSGDYDGDGNSDILWRNLSTLQLWVYTMDGATISSSDGINMGVRTPPPTSASIVGSGDYDGDGNADILWRDTSTGFNWIYFMNGATIVDALGVNIVSGTDWAIVGNGDYDGDGDSDILWRNGSTGQNWMYLMNGATISSSVGVNTIASTDWQVAGEGDYDGDGDADIFWRNTATGQNWMYLMNGNTIDSSLGVNTIPVSWQAVNPN
jgi:hypothetical protein